MKKTLAIILSIVMLLGVMPFGAFAADYDRAKIAANDTATIDALSEEQIASVIFDWVDRQIAAATADFESFEVDVMGTTVAVDIPEIKTLDDVITYKDYIAKLGGDFAKLDTTNLKAKGDGTYIEFIGNVLQFMADNSETFGKVFRWDDEVFDYGKVGEYILALDTTVEENKKIRDFYDNYLIGNDIQAKFTKWVADQMNYTIPEGETFDDTLNKGIRGWFVGLCKDMGILSETALATLNTYDLRTTDIYTLIKNFVALAEEDNAAKLDTYYNYIMDTVVRTLMKTMLGQKAVVGAAAEVPAGFSKIYTDLALLEKISGGTAYYYDGANYYQVTVANGVATANALTWEAGFEMNLEPIYATILTGKDAATTVQTYEPKSTDISISTYTTEKNNQYIQNAGLEVTGTEVPAEIKAVMTAENAKALSECFGLKVTQGEEEISKLVIGFDEIVTLAKAKALPMVKAAASAITTEIVVNDIDFDIVYNGYATEDEFIVEVSISDVAVDLAKAEGSTINDLIFNMAKSAAETKAQDMVASFIDLPIATIVVDGLSGGGADYFGQAEALLNFVNDDFVIDQTLLDFSANYDAYNGVVGQVNRVLVGLVKMFVNEDLGLKEGGNEHLTDNLETLCAKVNSMMEAANDLINNEDLQGMIKELGVDFDALTADLPLDLLYSLDFSSVEALWVTVITLGLDVIDDGKNELITEIHALIGDLENLDAMAVATTDYALSECIPALNKAFADGGIDFALTVPEATDAKTVAEDAGKDIIMTKLVDLLYEAATKGVVLANDLVNEAIGHVEGETATDLPTVNFQLKVQKGATWMETLTALTDRAYALLKGIVIACDNDYTDTIDKISAVANAILPLGSLASNCAGNGFAFDGNLVMGFLFNDGLDGDLEGFLRLFETKTKTEDVAADVSVTEALIKASEHIVDAIFPDTVKSELYVNVDYSTVSFTETTVQEYFTSAENDAVIASNNMDSINARKADLVPAALKLVREAGVLPYFAKCDKDHSAADLETVKIPGTPATCTEGGIADAYACAECGYIVSGGEATSATGHSYGDYVVTTAATCTKEGVKTSTCSGCGDTKTATVAKLAHSYGGWEVSVEATCTTDGKMVSKCTCGAYLEEAIPATGHVDADGNDSCDACGESLKEEDNSFFGKIKAFFQRIIDWFKNLFSF